MFCLNDTMRYYLCPGRTDMRKGISSLCGVVHEKMRSDVRNGDVFIFIGSSRRLMKLLHAEDGGMMRYVKRLEAGRFKLPEYDENTQSYQMEWRDLVVMVEGIQESPEQRLRRLRAQRREYVVQQQAKSWMPERPKDASDQLVFPNAPKPGAANRALKTMAKRAGINKLVTFHTSRHTFATMTLTAGTDIYTTNKLLGHTSVHTTEIYADVVMEKKADAVNLTNGLFG